MPSFSESVKTDYQRLFDSCIIRDSKYSAINRCVETIMAGKEQYEAIAAATGVPRYFIGIVHLMECSCNFKKHLHNGYPLTAKTVRVPKGYPRKGNPPFSFFDSAVDALNIEGFSQWPDWSIGGMLYCFEKYNGFGYRRNNINSSYPWSGSNQYSKGKYVRDGVFDPQAVSSQIGTAVVLRRMSELQLAIAGEKDTISLIKTAGRRLPMLLKNFTQTLNSCKDYLMLPGNN